MRIPAPAALLVEHPAVPVPSIDGPATESPAADDRTVSELLSRRERYSVGLQLTAAASLLAEFDLWPGRAAIEHSTFVRTSEGVRASLARFPMSMSRVFARLGGGEGAAVSTRAAVLAAISKAVGLTSAAIDDEKGEPGFFLERAMARQLRQLSRPLDACTARALWAFRWDELPLPERAATNYWWVPFPEVALRLAGALWADLLRRRRSAWLLAAGTQEPGTVPAPHLGVEGTLIVVGKTNSEELAAISRWAQGGGRSAVVIGEFPAGWHPPAPPAFDAHRLHRHLAVTGIPLEDARRVVEQRRGRIDPFDANDRRALTEAGRRVFASQPSRSGTVGEFGKEDRLRRILSLCPEGLPSAFLALHAGLSRWDLEEQQRGPAVAVRGDRWRLTEPAPLEPDPLHSAVADLFEKDDPRALLHRALGCGDAVDLAFWSRDRLDALDGFAVRDLLSVVSPGALGQEIDTLLTEACLSILDISGARRALSAIPKDRSGALTAWLDALDSRSAARCELPSDDQIDVSARAVAESALFILNLVRRRGNGRGDRARALIERACDRLAPLIRRRIEIDLAWIGDGDAFDDPSWRRRAVGDHPVLRAHYAHRRALQLMDRGRPRAVRRFLELLTDDRMGPGFLGLVEHDLGATALDEGRSLEADRHQLRAYRLLQAAGFRNVTHRVLFNLAVGDLDQLEIRRAEARFSELAHEDPSGPFLTAELARLALAKGELAEFRRSLEAFEASIDANNPRFREGLQLLRGVAALFDGELARARGLLQDAGQEGDAWSALVDAMAGREAARWHPDGWGVSLAAQLIHDVRSDGNQIAAMLANGEMTKTRALAIALAEHAGRARLPISEAVRVGAVRNLREAGIDGWADAVAGRWGREHGVVEALAEIVESSGPENLAPDLASRLLVALGVSGLELRNVADGSLVWHAGSGTPGAAVRHGRIVVVPLGGEAHEGPTWRLLTGILELFAPASPPPSDPEIEETGFYGISGAARAVRRELCELGPTHLPILLVGETGVGKEVAAKALHRLSKRDGAFVPVNVAAIPASLLEAELFGSVKGAFTGADRSRQGLVVAADRGTLFLDEVGDLDPPLQVKLLRFLESQEVRAVGASHSRQVDVRIVSATHRDLDQRVREGAFRQDLYYRIAAPPLAIPPLRERREDIGLLKDRFEREATTRHGLASCTWSREAETILRRYHWPGNVRELRQAVEVALVRAAGSMVKAEHLPISEPEKGPIGRWDEAQLEFRRRFLVAALERNNGNRSATARELGISRQTLLYHIRNLGIAGRNNG